MREDIRSFLSRVEKPGRYTGGEPGSVYKDLQNVRLRVAFCFPDTYEIGMSNLGMRILCQAFNELDAVWCERVYAPWVDMEKEMREDYGALSKQSNLMLLPREMSWQVINLAGLDLKMAEKVKTAILAIVDRIKIPANQVAIIDAQSSKQLANGSEIREGDKLKYKTFRRLFERTWVDMATYYGLKISYAIDGEPIGESAEVNAE